MDNLVAEISDSEMAAYCQRWKIVELAVFGSVLRDDFGPNSDIDLLVTFSPEADWGLLDHLQMQEELKALLRRDIDLVSKSAINRSENWLRRQEILSTAQIIFPESELIHAQ
jgi:predicted nucleotidyltransferase